MQQVLPAAIVANSVSDAVGLEPDFQDAINKTIEAVEFAVNCTYTFAPNLKTKLWILIILLPIVCVLGIIGNVLAVFVLLQKKLRGPNNYYLTALAICDIGIEITAVLLYSVEAAYDYFKNFFLYQMWINYLQTIFFLSHTFQVAEIYMTVGATVERFIAIVFVGREKLPIHQCCNTVRTFFYIALITLFAIGFSVFKFFEIAVTTKPWCIGFSSYSLGQTEFAQNQTYSLVYSVWLTHLLVIFIPFTLLIVLNGYASYRFAVFERRLGNYTAPAKPNIRKSRSGKAMLQYSIEKSITDQHRAKIRAQRHEANVLLLIVVGVFIGCNSPGFVLTLVEHAWPTALSNHPFFYSLCRDMVNLLTAVSASSNFVIYIIFGSGFRRGLKGLALRFLPCCFKKRVRQRGLAESTTSEAEGFVETMLKAHYATIGLPLMNGRSPNSGGILDTIPSEFYDLHQLKKLGLPKIKV